MNKEFHIKKNVLDNEYSRTLSHFQITTVGLITVAVGVIIYLLQTSTLLSAVQTSLSMMGVGILSYLMFNKKLNYILSEIKQL